MLITQTHIIGRGKGDVSCGSQNDYPYHVIHSFIFYKQTFPENNLHLWYCTCLFVSMNVSHPYMKENEKGISSSCVEQIMKYIHCLALSFYFLSKKENFMHQQVSVTIFGKCTFDVERKYVQWIISYKSSLMLFKFSSNFFKTKFTLNQILKSIYLSCISLKNICMKCVNIFRVTRCNINNKMQMRTNN